MMKSDDSNDKKSNRVKLYATEFLEQNADNPDPSYEDREQEHRAVSDQSSGEHLQVDAMRDEIAQLYDTSRVMREEIKKTQVFISQWYKKNKSLFESMNTPIQTLVEGSESLSVQLDEMNGMIQDLSKSLHLHTSSSTTAQTHIDELVSSCQKDIQKVKSELTLIFYLLGIGFVLLFIVSLMK